MKTHYKSIAYSYLESHRKRALKMIGGVWEKERFFTRESEKDHLACSGKGSGEMVPSNINEGPISRKPIEHPCLLKSNK